MEEAVTLTRVLRGLIRKSQPPHEHPDVLSRPMDARADVRAFLAERSKVLHMSGLPHDTTQSELESWFTQFGGRPIAFWTLRTPDQHKPTGSGFAVFSSHEEVSIRPFDRDRPFNILLSSYEAQGLVIISTINKVADIKQAAESLCMNGRALNEKAIEVSPSSSRVLDRAAEILTPFLQARIDLDLETGPVHPADSPTSSVVQHASAALSQLRGLAVIPWATLTTAMVLRT